MYYTNICTCIAMIYVHIDWGYMYIYICDTCTYTDVAGRGSDHVLARADDRHAHRLVEGDEAGDDG